MLDVSAVRAEAEEEILSERSNAAKNTIKDKLREIATCRQALQNMERELEAMMAEIEENVG